MATSYEEMAKKMDTYLLHDALIDSYIVIMWCLQRENVQKSQVLLEVGILVRLISRKKKAKDQTTLKCSFKGLIYVNGSKGGK